MSAFNATALIVDDASPSVVYSPGWVLDIPSSAEYNQTKHGATAAGLTATFKFTGTGIEVYGSLGSIDVYGRPVSSYSIDSVQQGTYQAPIINPGFAQTNVLFFRSPPLSPATHTLEVTNQNGTAPSTLWLDYFVFTPSADSASASGSSASQSLSGSASISKPSSASSSSQSLTLPPTSSGFVQTTSSAPGTSAPVVSTSPAVTSHAAKAPTGAIAGGVVGGVAVIVIIAALLYFFKRQKKAQAEDINPFGSWRDPSGSAGLQKFSTPPHSPPGTPVPPAIEPLVMSEAQPPSTSSKRPIVLRPPHAAVDGDAGSSMAPTAVSVPEAGPITLQHNDSGVRLPRPVVEVPPAYSAD
ncbi:hypothetical protein CERSUDRAFT_116958 [Gelatoporia subvermispora B]|uniref:Uncharacterized protein n=1 Tax=Ceriporiopsis subvermispora (strain B) TaxID=914234 RepID=M2QCM0_CERS8|nr:hypothetical protein CERSUDRAFT_116958 [Gelatoporia subvermispora B]